MITNKRQLKKMITDVCTALANEILAQSTYEHEKLREDASTLIHAVLFTQDDFLRRISHPEPGMKPKRYYDNLIEQFNQTITEYIDQLNTLGAKE